MYAFQVTSTRLHVCTNCSYYMYALITHAREVTYACVVAYARLVTYARVCLACMH